MHIRSKVYTIKRTRQHRYWTPLRLRRGWVACGDVPLTITGWPLVAQSDRYARLAAGLCYPWPRAGGGVALDRTANMAARNALKTWTCWLAQRRDSLKHANKSLLYSLHLLWIYCDLALVLRNIKDLPHNSMICEISRITKVMISTKWTAGLVNDFFNASISLTWISETFWF